MSSEIHVLKIPLVFARLKSTSFALRLLDHDVARREIRWTMPLRWALVERRSNLRVEAENLRE
jgi:hypothetical protein